MGENLYSNQHVDCPKMCFFLPPCSFHNQCFSCAKQNPYMLGKLVFIGLSVGYCSVFPLFHIYYYNYYNS